MTHDLKAEARDVFGPEPGERAAVLTCMADVQAEQVSWLWPSRFPLGKLSLIVGDPAVGKSFLTCALAAAVSRGAPWPDGSGHAPRGSVIMLNAEDGTADTIKPRLEAAGADCAKVFVLEAVRVADDKGKFIEVGFSLADVAALEAAILKADDCKAVFIDPVSAYMGGTDSHVNSDVRGLLKPLSDLAQKHGVAVVLVSHLNKSAAQAMYRTTGSLAFIAAARAAWCCVADKDDAAKRMILALKSNLAPDPGGMGYMIRDGMVQWTGRVDADVNQALAAPARDAGDSAISEAQDFLRDELAQGPKPASEILKSAKQAGISERTLREAKANLKVASVKPPGSTTWAWKLPAAAEAADVGDTVDRMIDRMEARAAGGNGHAH